MFSIKGLQNFGFLGIILLVLSVISTGCDTPCPTVPVCQGEQCTDCAFIAEYTSKLNYENGAQPITLEQCELCQNTDCDLSTGSLSFKEGCEIFSQQCDQTKKKIQIKVCGCSEDCESEVGTCGWDGYHPYDSICSNIAPI